ncbi:MAG TPA: hypothetical protein VFS43_46035 [Polyangiaceae bacterium]|nr:hypothetical protein [Polyangiaceae bacterium]
MSPSASSTKLSSGGAGASPLWWRSARTRVMRTGDGRWCESRKVWRTVPSFDTSGKRGSGTAVSVTMRFFSKSSNDELSSSSDARPTSLSFDSDRTSTVTRSCE